MTRGWSLVDFEATFRGFLRGIEERRRDAGFSLVAPDLRMLGHICRGNRSEHQLRGCVGYSPSTLERLKRRRCLVRGADGLLWLTPRAVDGVLASADAISSIDPHVSGHEVDGQWPFQIRKSDPLSGLECILGPPVLYLLGVDLEARGWSDYRIDHLEAFLEAAGLLEDGLTPGGRSVRAAFTGSLSALSRGYGSAGGPEGLVAVIADLSCSYDWTKNHLELELSIPWHRVPPSIDHVAAVIGNEPSLRVDPEPVIRTRSVSRRIEPELFLKVSENLDRPSGEVWEAIRHLLSRGEARLELNGVEHRATTPPSRQVGAHVGTGQVKLASVARPGPAKRHGDRAGDGEGGEEPVSALERR